MKKVVILLNIKLKNKFIATVLAPFVYIGMMLYYGIAKVIYSKSKITMSKEQALDNISKIYTKKDIQTPDIRKDNTEKIFDISIIMPAYNAEEFIGMALSSIEKQKTKYTYEVIIVNDGSTDGTLQEINKHIHIQNVKIISQENSGTAVARNKGIEEARGRYLMFLDADDELGENAIEKLLKTAYKKDAPIVIGGYALFSGNTILKITKHEDKTIYDAREIIQQNGFPCMKVFKSELFQKVRFTEGYWFEDTIICYLIYTQCDFIVTISDIVYYYRKNEKSSSRTAPIYAKSIDSYFIVEKIYKDIVKENIKFTYSMYEFSIYPQLSWFLYSRIKLQDEEIKKSVFVLASDLIQQMKEQANVHEESKDKIVRKLERYFSERNYEMWKLTSIIGHIIK